MLNKLTNLIPISVLRAIFNSSFAELIKRGDIGLPGQDQTTTTEYGGFCVRLYTEQNASYTTTWAVYKGDDLICEGDDEFYSSMGEAESSAIKWINSQRLSVAVS